MKFSELIFRKWSIFKNSKRPTKKDHLYPTFLSKVFLGQFLLILGTDKKIEVWNGWGV